MLKFKCEVGRTIHISDQMTLTVLSVGDNQIEFGIEIPKNSFTYSNNKLKDVLFHKPSSKTEEADDNVAKENKQHSLKA